MSAKSEESIPPWKESWIHGNAAHVAGGMMKMRCEQGRALEGQYEGHWKMAVLSVN